MSLPHGTGRLTSLRIYSGTVQKGQTVVDAGTGRRERISRILRIQADRHTDVEQAVAGDIVAVTGLKAARTGTTLREPGSTVVVEPPATAERIVSMAISTGTDMKSLRDRAVLLMGFAGAFRRSELVALNLEDLEESELGFKVIIRHSKTDQEGAGQTIAIVRGSVACPIAALKAWLAAAGIVELREAVAKSISRSRGIKVNPDDVVVGARRRVPDRR